MTLIQHDGRFGVEIDGPSFPCLNSQGKSLGTGKMFSTKWFDTEQERSEFLATQESNEPHK